MFADFRIDVQRRRLLRNGEPVALKPKALETLLVLIEHRGRVVEKDELMRRLWPDTVVEEANLTQNVFMIRKALGELPGEQRFIATAARRGYRFVADVREVWDGPDGAPATEPRTAAGARAHGWLPGRRALAAGLGALAVAVAAMLAGQSPPAAVSSPIERIAVLPFENVSGDPGQEYFADGMTDAVITDLTSISALQVVSRQSVMRFKGSREPLATIGRRLGADGIVQGTVARSGGRVRVTVQLVDARSDTALWGATYDRHLGDVLVLQGELAGKVAGAIQVRLKSQERAALADRRQIDPDVYDHYLRGRHLFGQRTEEALRKSLAYYGEATRLDPLFASAHAGMALTFVPLGYAYDAPGESRLRIRAAAERALALDGSLTDAHVALAAVTVIHDWNWDEGERAWTRILERSPNNAAARHWYGFLLSLRGRVEEALEQQRLALTLDPLSASYNTSLADSLRLLGRFDEAVRRYRSTLDLDPRFCRARIGLSAVHVEQGDLEAAIVEAERAVAHSERDPLALSWLGHVLGLAGRRDEAQAVLRELTRRAEAGYLSPVYLAEVHAGLGERRAALAYLEEAYRQRSPRLVEIAEDIGMRPLAADPGFADLLRRLKLAPSRAQSKPVPAGETRRGAADYFAAKQ